MRFALKLRLNLQHRGILWLQSLALRAGRKALPAHLRTGERGELEALFFLRRLGYIVVARRWRSAELNGDLDLIAWEGDTLCFVEVKARSERDRSPAALAIDGPKRRMLARMIRAYLRTQPQPRNGIAAQQLLTRLDVVSVYLLPAAVECELLRDAFDWRRADSTRYGV